MRSRAPVVPALPPKGNPESCLCPVFVLLKDGLRLGALGFQPSLERRMRRLLRGLSGLEDKIIRRDCPTDLPRGWAMPKRDGIMPRNLLVNA